MTHALVIENLTKRYKDFTLDKISFSLPQGTILGIIGENGSGKSTLINTMLGMRIDVKCRKPIIANVMGGFSGAAIFPVAVRMVYQVARACRIPVMGCGGVETARDVIEMMMAGATAVQVGAANLRNPYACKEIVEALPREMERLGIERLSDIIGIVK